MPKKLSGKKFRATRILRGKIFGINFAARVFSHFYKHKPSGRIMRELLCQY